MIYLDMQSRKVCIAVSTSVCCDDPVVEMERFRVDIVREGDQSEEVLLSYDMFDVNNEGQMCILLDDSMGNLPTGRYLMLVVFDGCTTVGFIRFMWANVPVVTDVSVESHAFEDCDTDCKVISKLPISTIACCEDETLDSVCADLNPDCER